MQLPRLVVVMTLAVITAAAAQPWIGDYNSEPRKGDHVDVDLLASRLQDLGANTYMWLIWHSPNDWEDLRGFLPKAQEAGISVWVYLVPPSETAAVHPELKFPYSEPFRLDYVRWAQEIAKLSLEHSNLIGYVIDDFWGNVGPDRFNAASVKRMVDAGKAINPELKFLTLMYPSHDQIGPQFARMLGQIVDGVVAAYPRDKEQIKAVLPYLQDTFEEPSGCAVSFPGWTPSKQGDCGFFEQTARVTGETARLVFNQSDNFDGPTKGYHFLQARVDDEVVWECDVAGKQNSDVELDLSKQVAGKDEVKISFGIVDKKGVSQFGITGVFADLRAEGLELQGLGTLDGWTTRSKGAFTIDFHNGYKGAGRFNLAMILMPSGARGEYKHRWGEEATSKLIAAKVRMCLELVREGVAQGVVTYCLDKNPGSADFDAVKAEFEAFSSPQ